MVYEAGLGNKSKKLPQRGFKILDFIKFLKLGLTELTLASGRCRCIRTVYASLCRTDLTTHKIFLCSYIPHKTAVIGAIGWIQCRYKQLYTLMACLALNCTFRTCIVLKASFKISLRCNNTTNRSVTKVTLMTIFLKYDLRKTDRNLSVTCMYSSKKGLQLFPGLYYRLGRVVPAT